jgi:hypothetical protein
MRFQEGGVRSPQSVAAIDRARSVGSVTVPEGSRSESGTLVVLDRGYAGFRERLTHERGEPRTGEVRRIHHSRSSE